MMKISSKNVFFTFNFEAIVYMLLFEIIITKHIVSIGQVISINFNKFRFFYFVETLKLSIF